MADYLLSWGEWFGFITALVYLYFSINQKIWLWPMGILTSAFYMSVFFDARLYADMVLQIYYLVVSIYGWIIWKNRQSDEQVDKIMIVKVNKSMLFKLLLAFGVLYVALAFILIVVPPFIGIAASDLPFWDAFTTAASFVATWMLAKKIIDQWLVWIVIDFVSMGMYFYKGLYVTGFLFFVYTVMAIWGYFSWLRDYKKYQHSIA
ncbi:nicotinamide riboside transporter PnuC [Saccharicrinis fermentans]|uniref:Nicotinamide riboside transporter PnuC n=1 Tax=Saccharicrinis fermentans DSM 9555 = JCM 21142 TaxID=869213 RepID=W7Y9B0_9BACT|nr:nicotinamide riboside transporter PnuC [Saccharicrinis fermentans]GAF04073.1 nicotinamide riboside transporter PnuC [Saccharicrinis fermentans DSM 9555 = JCM 21142]